MSIEQRISGENISTNHEGGESINVVESIVEIPPAIRTHLEEIKKIIEILDQGSQEYEKLISHDKDNIKKGYFKPELNFVLNTKIWPYYAKLLAEFNFVNYLEHVPSVRQSHGFGEPEKVHREVKYLPKTIEAAFLANNDDFVGKLEKISTRIKEYELLENYDPNKKAVSDYRKWDNFLQLFLKIPRDDKEQIKKWLLAPSSRVSYSIFTHVTSELALDDILDSGSLKSAGSAAPSSKDTGSFSSTSMATEFEKSAIYFDQNNVSLNYGVSGEAIRKGHKNEKIRRIWFVTRGDLLLRHGLLDLASFEDAHPFTAGHGLFGSMFISPQEESAEVPIEEFIIFIPEDSDNIRKKIETVFPNVTILTYNKSLYSSKERRALDINTIRDIFTSLKDKFGSVQVPNLSISSLNLKQTQGITFPVTVNLNQKSMPENIQNNFEGSQKEPVNPEIQQSLDTFYAGEFLEYNPEARDEAFNTLTRYLAHKEGFDPSMLDVNYELNPNPKAADLEVIDLDEKTGEYHIILNIRNKFTEGEEERPKKWKFEYRFKVSPSLVEKYKEKLSTE